LFASVNQDTERIWQRDMTKSDDDDDDDEDM
jgi:hypothetical protein